MSVRGAIGASRRSEGGSQARDQQAVFDGIKPLGALGVARAHFMFAAIAVGKVSGHSHSARKPLDIFR